MADIKTITTVPIGSTKTIMTTPKGSALFIGGGQSRIPTVASVFKTALREIATPTIEFLMNSRETDGTLTNTGSDSVTGPAMTSAHQDATADETGGFDGLVHISGAAGRVSQGFGSSEEKIDRSADRTWIFVFDITANMGNGYLNFGSPGTSKNAWGWTVMGAQETGGTAGQFASRYFFGSFKEQHAAHMVELNNIHGTGSANRGAGSPSTCVTVTGSGVPRRTVLMYTFDHSEAEGTVRWKQTGDSAGHTYITEDVATSAGSWSGVTYWMGYSSVGPVGTKWKYIAVADTIFTEANFDTLADIALGV
jgi:hypothetical protein